jgi:AcrR family transcriptional regulator
VPRIRRSFQVIWRRFAEPNHTFSQFTAISELGSIPGSSTDSTAQTKLNTKPVSTIGWRTSADKVGLNPTAVGVFPDGSCAWWTLSSRGSAARADESVSTVTRTRRERSRRDEVLTTAASLISAKGLGTSMLDIANASGMLSGSLYYHFPSRDALLTELLRRYHADLNTVAEEALAILDEPTTRPGFNQIEGVGAAIAQCAVNHRAAIQISMYETPSSDDGFNEWARRRPTLMLDALYQILRGARWTGYMRSDVDLRVLADRICQTMLEVGLEVVRHHAQTRDVARLLCRIILTGLATTPPSDVELDGSAAFAAAEVAIAGWTDDAASQDRAAQIRAAARAEFGRSGYESTTLRDIAAAAGVTHGTVLRLVGSKEHLLEAIMAKFADKIDAGARAVLRSEASVVEKLDALSWININALDRFTDEFRIQLAWMRRTPQDTPASGAIAGRLRKTESLLLQGIRSGELNSGDAPHDMLARCVNCLTWIPETILRDVGRRAALIQVRDTLVRGSAIPVAAK